MLAARYYQALRKTLRGGGGPAEPFVDTIDDKPMPLLEHLVELRRRLIWAMGGFLVAFMVCYYFGAYILDFLAQPLLHVMAQHGDTSPHLIFTNLTEPFFTRLKVAMFGGAFISFPLIAGQAYMFVAPGLYRSEKSALRPFLVATPVLFILGALLAYYVIFPAAFTFFVGFENNADNGGVPLQLQAKIGEYLDLVMKIIFAFGVAFQLPVLLTLLAKVGIVTVAGLKRYRRYAYVGMFVIAAILTPPRRVDAVRPRAPAHRPLRDLDRCRPHHHQAQARAGRGLSARHPRHPGRPGRNSTTPWLAAA